MKIFILILILLVFIILWVRKQLKSFTYDGGTYDDWYDEDEDTGIDGINDFKN